MESSIMENTIIDYKVLAEAAKILDHLTFMYRSSRTYDTRVIIDVDNDIVTFHFKDNHDDWYDDSYDISFEAIDLLQTAEAIANKIKEDIQEAKETELRLEQERQERIKENERAARFKEYKDYKKNLEI